MLKLRRQARELAVAACLVALVASCSGSGSNAAASPSTAHQDSGPMLIDDKGRAVENPALVKRVYALLQAGDTVALNKFGEGNDLWQTENMPQLLSRADVRAKIMKSMTVHPDCVQGCTYPGFANTGWDSDQARKDGKKLGVDPIKVPHPDINLPVYTSDFPACACSWLGTTAPKQ